MCHVTQFINLGHYTTENPDRHKRLFSKRLSAGRTVAQRALGRQKHLVARCPDVGSRVPNSSGRSRITARRTVATVRVEETVEWLAIDGQFDVDVSCSSNLGFCLSSVCDGPVGLLLSLCHKSRAVDVMCCVQPESMIHG